ncbi:class I SAM-dependent methyltransferase [Desulfopila sp. IMCC35008]|uniref:class I SAM-dependent methyltransferase n=1 Tax=Desulfopila sp. IMCC35008 TaxID=2653858 RepID=UPI0013D49CAB|nr:class I SAM-dependent methyltransferase [Desulfopila sp. IMCC35008]
MEQVRTFYSRILKPGAAILDLMSSHDSHLPPDFVDSEITGLGLNKTELAANAMLTDHVVHDLNSSPLLPFDDNCFDAVICTVSIEYLTQPYEIMIQVARVLRPGGLCAIAVSNRWFPGKQIQPWSHLHPFERQGMVLGFLIRSGLFKNLQTESIRGLSRPIDDKHYRTTQLSDPLFFIWGMTK